MARKAEVNKWSYIKEYRIYISFRVVDAPAHVSLRPTDHLWTLKTEGHTCTVTLLKVRNKQRT